MLSHPRRFWIIGTLLALVVLAAFVVVRGCSSSGQLADPRSYRLVQEWTSQDAGLPIAVTTDDGTALLWGERTGGGGHVITAVDTRTGKVKWTGAPAGWDVNIDYIRGGKLTADAVIVESNYQRARPAIAALDLGDGKVRWQLPTPGEFGRPLAVTDDAVVAAWDATTLRGLDADDGHTLWETRVEAGCKADELVGNGSLVVVEVVCEKRRYLQSVRPRSGDAGWRVDVTIETRASVDDLSVYGDVAVLRDEERLTIIDDAGRELLVAQTRGQGGAQVVATDDLVVVAYRDKERGDVVTAIDRGDATPRWSRPAAIASLSLAQGRLFALGRLPAPLLPIGLYEIDPASGRMAVSATHLLHAEYDSLVTVVDDIVVSHYVEGRQTPRTIMLAGHKLDPAAQPDGFAGGAAPDSWPSGCDLLTVTELAAKAKGVAYQAQPQQTVVADSSLPRPAGCRYEPSSVKAPEVTAGIAWVAQDAEQAVQVMANLWNQHGDSVKVPGLGDEAIEVVAFDYPESTVQLYLRVGARIGTVAVPQGRAGLARELAPMVLARLG